MNATMKSITRISGILLGLLLLFTQCDDNILESTSYGQVTSQQFWRNGDDVVSAVNAIYEPLLQENYFGHYERTWDINLMTCGVQVITQKINPSNILPMMPAIPN
jgi:hypothetical protein